MCAHRRGDDDATTHVVARRAKLHAIDKADLLPREPHLGTVHYAARLVAQEKDMLFLTADLPNAREQQYAKRGRDDSTEREDAR